MASTQPPARRRPRRYGAGVACVFLLVLALMSTASRGRDGRWYGPRQYLAARADTDTTALRTDSLSLDRLAADTLGLDSLSRGAAPADSAFGAATADSVRADSALAAGDSVRALQYLPRFSGDRFAASPVMRSARPLGARFGSYWRTEVELDSAGALEYTARERVGGADIRYPIKIGLDAYREARYESGLTSNWLSLVEQHERVRQMQQRGGLGVSIVVPGGRSSAFSTIFGKNEVDLRVTGQAYIQAGFDHRKSEQQAALLGRSGRTDPTFKQDLSLGITGSIGDKMRVDVSWDTQNQFDYQNQLKLQYTGYEDEIIQNIEAGNVFLQTPSTLIRGGQSLFGIKSELQIGGVRLTTVASQQEGQSNNLAIKGGAQEVVFDLRPTDYDESTHFFLAYYFRNRWEKALSTPPNIVLANGFEGITDIEVWKLQPNISPEEQGARQAIALVDLAEQQQVLTGANVYTEEALPLPTRDQYTDEEIRGTLAEGTLNPDDYLKSAAMDVPLRPSDYQNGLYKPLVQGRDYDIDPILGYLSLRSRLQDNEALAVSFRYKVGNEVYTVGTFASETGGAGSTQNDRRLVLKLLRPTNLRQPSPADYFSPAAWFLEMRNIYRLQSYNINESTFDLNVEYEPPGKSASTRLPGVGGAQTLLQLLGLDRLNTDEAPSPDDRFDFLVNYTIEPSNGRLIFPYLQPFGSRLDRVITQLGSAEAQANRDLLVFNRLYLEKKENAQKDTQRDVYRIRGAFQGSIQSYYDLGAFSGIIQGSVRVTSGGTPLQENADYIVDYTGGTVTITNPSYLTAGRDIDITYESNSFLNIQKKTLIGARADYQISDRIGLGATLMRLSQKSPVDKFRLGEEPVSNTIWGIDGQLDFEPRWLTRAVDLLPLIQTKEPSAINITGEFAALRPGHTETIAFAQARRRLQKLKGDARRDFSEDELSGVSYVDDFEGFENTLSLKQPGAWLLSAAPDSVPAVDRLPGDPAAQTGSQYVLQRNDWRSTFGWYQISSTLLQQLGLRNASPATNVVLVDSVLNKNVKTTNERYLNTLDLYIHPRERGPYNYNTRFDEFYRNPRLAWGGMTQRLPEGYTDFDLKNIEFIEFIFRPFSEAEGGDAGKDAKLYLDLGSISEDLIPNGKINTEDALETDNISRASLDILKRSRLPEGLRNQTINIDKNTRRTEDLGLDGLASYDPSLYVDTEGRELSEQSEFKFFLDALNPDALPDAKYRAEIQKARRDPSGDDYQYYLNDRFFTDNTLYPEGASLQQRFSHFFPGLELNSYQGQTELAKDLSSQPRGNSRYPDTEDINLNSSVDLDNSYFQYEIPLSLNELARQAQESETDDYIVTELINGSGRPSGWYQARIPVRRFTRRVGDIQDFSLIESIRIWTTGHEAPATIRFATFELVGTQWQKSTVIAGALDDPTARVDSTARLTISSINNEENADQYRPPNEAVVSQTRSTVGQTEDQREQSMLIRVENLKPGQQTGIFKPFQGKPLDLLKYHSLRMFTHLDGKLGDGTSLGQLALQDLEEARSKARLFIRIGSNETNDYYEYEQPLTPSPYGDLSPDALWQTHRLYNGEFVDLNSVVVDLGALNRLQIARDTPDASGRAFPRDSVYYNLDASGMVRPGAPDAAEFAPPGTRLAVKGTPSLSRVNTIVIGVRNPNDPRASGAADELLDASVWVNELRVAGYDATGGRAGLLNADFALADFGQIRGNFQLQTDGFGELSSTLDDRDQSSFQNWGVIADLKLDKFVPAKYGWSVPVSVQLQSNTSTPRYSPSRADVQLDQILAGIEDKNLPADQEQQLKREALETAQNYNFTRSVTGRLQKTGSDSRVLRNTLDGLSLNYSYTDTDARNPSLRESDSWRWMTGASYRFAMRRPRTLRPFWFTDEVPILGLLGDLRFNYTPQAVNLSGTATRDFGFSQERRDELREGAPTRPEDALPDLVAYPLREQHAFTHRRTASVQYNPFQFLNLGFDTGTDQSLNRASVDTLFSVIYRDSTAQAFGEPVVGTSLEQALAQGLIDAEAERDGRAYEVTRLNLVPTGSVVTRLFNGAASPRTDRYTQRFTATFQPRFGKNLDWMIVQPVSYNVDYYWTNGSVARNTGAAVGSRVELRGGLTLQPQELWRKFDFYKNLERKQLDTQAAKKSAREARKNTRAEAKRLRAVEREARRLEEEARAAAGDSLAADAVDVLTTRPPGAAGAPLEEAAPADTTGGGFRLPLPSAAGLYRRLVLAVTGLSDLSILYQNSQSSASTNVGLLMENGEVKTQHSLWDAIHGEGPSAAYRFGLDRRVPLYDRAILSSVQATDALTSTQRVQARATLQPSRSLQVNLNWSVDWGNDEDISYRLIDESGLLSTAVTEAGTNRASVWAFRADYGALLEKQFRAYLADWQAGGMQDEFGDENGDNRVVLTNNTVTEDFISSFVTGSGTLDGKGFLPLPMPSWTVAYTGLSEWPIIRRLVNSASLRHGYSAEYATDFRTNAAAFAADPLSTFNLGNQLVTFRLPYYEAGAIRINERFSPLVGVDMSLGRMNTTVSWNKSSTYSLSPTTASVSDMNTNEIAVTASYQRQGLRLFFMPGRRLNNRIGLSLTGAYAKTQDLTYNLNKAITDAIASYRQSSADFDVQSVINTGNRDFLTDIARLSVTPKISYQFSNRVSADFTLKYEKFMGDNRQLSYTNINGNFNVRVSISN